MLNGQIRYDSEEYKEIINRDGGAGSGNWGHSGRPGKQGGSSGGGPSGGVATGGKYEVKQTVYKTPGKASQEVIKSFDNPGEADKWLTNHIKENKLTPTDFTIGKVKGTEPSVSKADFSKGKADINSFKGMEKGDIKKALDDAPDGARITGVKVKNGPHKGTETIIEKSSGYRQTAMGEKYMETSWSIAGEKDPYFGSKRVQNIINGTDKYYEI